MADHVISEFERICSRCGLSKPANLEFFSVKRKGLNTRCKICVREFYRLRWADPEFHAKQIAKRAIKYGDPLFREKEKLRNEKRKTDPSHIAYGVDRQRRRSVDPAFQKKETERNRKRRENEEYCAKIRESSKRWYAANKARHSECTKARYNKNRDEIRAKRSRPAARELTNKWTRNHLRKNPHLKVIRSVGAAIAEILKEGRVSGGFRFLPYTKVELRSHLERQFVAAMSWDNYGLAWHVDHIVPQASFKIDPNNPKGCPEFQACWALTNLRPLWKQDNQSKSAKRIYLL